MPRGPAVVVERVPAHVDHRVNRQRPADDLPAGKLDAAPVAVGLRLRLEVPDHRLVLEHRVSTHRDVDERVPIPAAGLQQHRSGTICGGSFARTHERVPIPALPADVRLAFADDEGDRITVTTDPGVSDAGAVAFYTPRPSLNLEVSLAKPWTPTARAPSMPRASPDAGPRTPMRVEEGGGGNGDGGERHITPPAAP